MSDNTKISWSEATWNVVTGCTKVSDGCLNCYIDRTPPFRMQHRKFDEPGIGGTTGVLLHPERLDWPMRWRKSRRIFVNSLADLFHDQVSDDFIARVWAVMATSAEHTFQVLTKRPARMRALLNSTDFRGLVDEHWHRVMAQRPSRKQCLPGTWPLPHVWVGTSTENQKTADLRIRQLLETDAAVHWISAEPLLGPIDLGAAAPVPYEREQGGFWRYGARTGLHGEGKVWVPAPPAQLAWVVCGGESGPGARPMDLAWARSLRDQCARAGIPFHFKQGGSVLGREWGGHSKGGDPASWPEPFPREYPAGVA